MLDNIDAQLIIDIPTFTHKTLNEFVKPGTIPVKITWDTNDTNQDTIVYENDTITLISYSKAFHKTFRQDGGFTEKQLMDAILDVETNSRPLYQSKWFGGIDVHHRFFEGLTKYEEGVYNIHFGS
jgi:hypothetical protein